MMKCKILNQDRWQRILEHRLTKVEFREVFDHFETDCEACDEFFGSMDEKTEYKMWQVFNSYNAINTEAVSELPTDKSTSESENVFWPRLAKILKTVIPINKVFTSGFAIFSLFAIGIGIFFQVNQDLFIEPLETEKGISSDIPNINIRFATGFRDEDGELTVNRGEIGGDYSSTETLFLSYKIPVTGYIYFVGYKDGNSAELLFPEQYIHIGLQSAGEHSIFDDKQIKGFSLNGLQGRYIIVGIHSVEPLDFSERVMPVVIQSAGSLNGSVKQKLVGEIGQAVSVDVVYFNVHA